MHNPFNYFQHSKQTRPCTAVGCLFELLHVFPLLLHSWIPGAEKGFTESLTTERKLQCVFLPLPHGWIPGAEKCFTESLTTERKPRYVFPSLPHGWIPGAGKGFTESLTTERKPCENPSPPSAWNQLPLPLRQTLSKLPAKDSSVWRVCFWHTHLHWPHSAAICFSQWRERESEWERQTHTERESMCVIRVRYVCVYLHHVSNSLNTEHMCNASIHPTPHPHPWTGYFNWDQCTFNL